MKNKSITWIVKYFITSFWQQYKPNCFRKKGRHYLPLSNFKTTYPTENWQQLSEAERLGILGENFKKTGTMPSKFAKT